MQRAKYQWQCVLETLRGDVESGRLYGDGRLPTIREVCARFEVSAITARRAFDELERAGLITRKRFVGASVCRAKIKNTLLPVTVVVPNWGDGHDAQPNWHRMEIQRGIMAAARDGGVQARMVAAALVPADARDENFLLTTNIPGGHAALRNLCRRNRVVCAYYPLPTPDVTTIRLDLRKAAELAAAHLVGLGHRRIALLLQDIANPWQCGRFDGYARMLKRRRIPWDWELVCEIGDIAPERITRALNRMFDLARPPMAVLCGNDMIAAMVIRECQTRHLPVPEKISVTGMDNIPDSAALTPPLTTIDTQLYKLGHVAMTTLVRRARAGATCAPEDVLIPPKLVVRGSTAIFAGGPRKNGYSAESVGKKTKN